MAYWGMQPTEDATFNLLLTSNASYEDTGWANAEFDALVQAGRSTTVESERVEAYAKAQELMLAELPYLIPFYEDVLTASKESVKGYSINPINRYFYLENVWLDEG
jgi:peptide/nickel transport system substrate-binding protein